MIRPMPIPKRPFAALDREVGVIAFGAFKLGRVDRGKFVRPYELPSEIAAARLLHGVIDLGIDLIDTAPAYGLSESRIGAAIADRRSGIVLCTKTGETRLDGESTFDYSERATEASVCRSLVRLRAESLDVVFVHSNGRDREVLEGTPVVETLDRLRRQGLLRVVGFSGKSVEGGLAAADDPRIDALMVEFNPHSTNQLPVLERAASLGKAVLVKKPLAQGRCAPAEAIPFILARPEVTSIVIGTLELEHLAEACRCSVSVSSVAG